LPSKVWVSTFSTKNIKTVKLLGSNEALKWEAVGKGIEVVVPEKLRKSRKGEVAWVVEVVR
ncbi:MAG: hypothetical protein IT258_21565, partial [Saprospiraceae bacterium]|nr:hypothetical protein [Saprospiraceae bacterium]